MTEIAKVLIIAGAILFVAGVACWAGAKLGLGRLPGDIVIRGRGFAFYFPIVTSILLSILLSLVLWLLFRGRGR